MPNRAGEVDPAWEAVEFFGGGHRIGRHGGIGRVQANVAISRQASNTCLVGSQNWQVFETCGLFSPSQTTNPSNKAEIAVAPSSTLNLPPEAVVRAKSCWRIQMFHRWSEKGQILKKIYLYDVCLSPSTTCPLWRRCESVHSRSC